MSMINKARAGLTRILASNLPARERIGIVENVDPALMQGVLRSKLRIKELEAQVQELSQREGRLKSKEQGLASELAMVESRLKESQEKFHEFKQSVDFKKKEELKVKSHPIYGFLLRDFGYKKVYATDPRKLCNKDVLPVWEKQRTLRPERAKAIAAAKAKDTRFGFPGVITIFDLDRPGKRGIIDGQHRIGGLDMLMSQGHWSRGENILTEVYTVPEDTVGELFREINQAQPVLEIDMPGSESGIVRGSINVACEKLAASYPNMFSASQRCRVPHLNIDSLRQQLFESDPVHALLSKEDDSEKGAEKLYEWLLSVNQKLGERAPEEWLALAPKRSQDAFRRGLEKSAKFSFFLGLDRTWA